MRIVIAPHQEEIKIAAGKPSNALHISVFMTRLCASVDFPIEFLCGGAHIACAEAQQLPQEQLGGTSMTDILLENLKLIVLFILIAAVIGMSHFGAATPARPKAHRKYDKPAPAGL
jgi:hypothetical protein